MSYKPNSTLHRTFNYLFTLSPHVVACIAGLSMGLTPLLGNSILQTFTTSHGIPNSGLYNLSLTTFLLSTLTSLILFQQLAKDLHDDDDDDDDDIPPAIIYFHLFSISPLLHFLSSIAMSFVSWAILRVTKVALCSGGNTGVGVGLWNALVVGTVGGFVVDVVLGLVVWVVFWMLEREVFGLDF